MTLRRQSLLPTLLAAIAVGAVLMPPSHRAVDAQTPAAAAAATGKTAIRFGKLWDGTKVITDAVVVVDGARVKSVGSGGPSVPANARVIDLSKLYAIPGLIDDHTHITYWAEAHPRAGVRPLQAAAGLATAVRVFMAQENARKSLEAGFTTVRDLGAQ